MLYYPLLVVCSAQAVANKLEITEEEALTIASDVILHLVQQGIASMILTADNDAKIKVTMTPYKEEEIPLD